MALNGAILFNSDWAMGITGYATPTPMSGDEVYAYYAVSFQRD